MYNVNERTPVVILTNTLQKSLSISHQLQEFFKINLTIPWNKNDHFSINRRIMIAVNAAATVQQNL